jgi:hypothetical protein
MSNEHLHPIMLQALAPWIPSEPKDPKWLAADLQRNADKNSGKLLRDTVHAAHQQEINVLPKLNGESFDTRP